MPGAHVPTVREWTVEVIAGEIVVAPAGLRFGVRLGSLFPTLNAAIQRRAGAAEIFGGHAGNN
jgi:hypothetical protein